MKLKGVDVESVPPPPQARHCSSPLQLGASGSHSRDCGRGGERSWLGRSEGRGWGGEFSPSRGGGSLHGGHSCHQGHPPHTHPPTQPPPAARPQEAAATPDSATPHWYNSFKTSQNN